MDKATVWQKENTKIITMRLNTATDSDILKRLEEVDSKQGYIRQLIREDMERKGINYERGSRRGNSKYEKYLESVRSGKKYTDFKP